MLSADYLPLSASSEEKERGGERKKEMEREGGKKEMDKERECGRK